MSLMRVTLLLAVIGIITVPVHAAKLYKWTDESGQVRYSDTPPMGRQYEQQTIRSSDDSASAKPADTTSMDDAAKKNPIVLYSVPRCESCDLIRLFLERNQLPFTELDVKNDLEAQKALIAHSGELRLPYLAVGKESLDSYSRAAMRNLLKRQGYPLIDATSPSTPDPS